MSSPSLTGQQHNGPTKYKGPNVNLCSVVTRNRIPTGADIKDPATGKYYAFSTFWIIGETSPGVGPVSGLRGDLWYLNYIASNIAYWSLISSGTGDLLSLSDSVTPTNNIVFPSLGSDTPPNNIKFNGTLNQQVTAFKTVQGNTAGHYFNINPMSPARWIVDPLSTTANPNGTHTTIQGALDACARGDTIMVMPGTYDETLTLKNECNLVAFNDDIAGTVIISGALTLDNNATGTYFCVSGIRFQRTSGSCITHSGSEVRQLFLTRCKIIVQGTATGITFTNTAVNSEIRLSYCAGDASDAGSKIFAMSGTDLNSSVIGFYSSYFTNGGSTTVPSTTANTNSSGINEFYNSTFALPVTTSGNATLRAFDTDFSNMTGTTVGNVTNLIIGGSGVNKVTGCVLNSGTAVAATISTTTLMTSTTITSSNTSALDGAGTLNYGDLVFTSSSGISVTNPTCLSSITFSAYASANKTNETGDGTNYTVLFDTKIFDKSNNYDTSTGIFTAPVTGIYCFQTSIFTTGLTLANSLSIEIISTSITNTIFYGTPSIDGGGNIILNGSAIVSMTVGDTAKIAVGAAGGAKVVSIVGGAPTAGSGPSSFSGFLIRN